MIIIGEKINGSIPAVAKAIAERDAEFIKDRARKQAAANATYIDSVSYTHLPLLQRFLSLIIINHKHSLTSVSYTHLP